MEAAGVGFEHDDKWFALVVNAADYNNAVKLGGIKPAAPVGVSGAAGVARAGGARARSIKGRPKGTNFEQNRPACSARPPVVQPARAVAAEYGRHAAAPARDWRPPAAQPRSLPADNRLGRSPPASCASPTRRRWAGTRRWRARARDRIARDCAGACTCAEGWAARGTGGCC